MYAPVNAASEVWQNMLCIGSGVKELSQDGSHCCIGDVVRLTGDRGAPRVWNGRRYGVSSLAEP
jgi:hypothetical protein